MCYETYLKKFFQVNSWLQWLAQSDSEEEDEEEDEEEKLSDNGT